jgi:tetratricopeptide (TPR) repeat protein
VRAKIREAFDEAKALGNQAYAQQQYDDALAFYHEAQRADPHNTTQMLHAVLSNMSAVHATKGDWRKSFHHAFEAVQLKQDYAKGHSRMATALVAMKMFREAQQSYHSALRLEPDNETVINQLRAVEHKLTAADGGGVSSAAHNAAHVLSHEPAVGVKREGRPSADDGGGKRQATNSSDKAAEGRSRVEELQAQGSAAFRQGEHARAHDLFTVAIAAAEPPNANLHANRSAVLCAMMRFEEAIADADRAVQIKPEWGRGHSRRGNALHAICKRGEDRWEEARQAYTRALEIDPDNAVVRRALHACIEQA